MAVMEKVSVAADEILLSQAATQGAITRHHALAGEVAAISSSRGAQRT